MNYKQLASQILDAVGGSDNINNVYHCSTRLRFTLNNADHADKQKIELIDGVLNVIKNGAQLQVIVGSNVSYVFRELQEMANISEKDPSNHSETEQKKKFGIGPFFDLIAGIFQPIVPVIAGAGMMKVLLVLLTMTGVLTKDGQTHVILSNIADAGFYFLPILIAYSSAIKFKVSPPLAIVASAVLLHPNMTALFTTGDPLSLFSIPLTPANYGGQVVPIILIVWFMSYVSKFADKVSPGPVKIFLSPLIVIAITGPIALLGLGPIGVFLGNGLTQGILAIQTSVGFIAIVILAVLMPIIVSLGIHKVFIPVMISSIANPGYDMLILVAHLCSNFAQSAASFAVSIKSKNKRMKQISLSSGITASFGITEPAIYGVTMKLKKPLYAAMVGAGVAAVFAGLMNLKAYVAVGPGLASLPMFIGEGSNFVIALITLVISFVVTFIMVFVIGFNDPESENTDDKSIAEPIQNGNVANDNKIGRSVISAPMNSETLSLSEVNDDVFAQEMMGKGIAFTTEESTLTSPVNGTIAALYDSKHAIGIVSDDGVELLIHIGIDTVTMKGEGFEALVNKGDRVSIGDKLIEFDSKAITARGLDPTIMLIVTNTQEYEIVESLKYGKVTQGEAILSVIKGEDKS
ncbi:beta-glucoside-specific PTS transporter subunit IIABC [Alkalicoccobacillus murimartini]|uniref:PTS system beta-glucosides-specific IIC component n=1 Tax=Alkalicoccobacillus murimartini TaxID=171685 RepID=A0ABT9YIJ7_9BACI|nr:beta-glucoside-specific PTS transporter subunit IIABC [Alkalicoccobacillus murimartini]MDQ0207315.1 PTS system beta-glucosides-specific IIC component [Alkalicoccobacillus murimartini]